MVRAQSPDQSPVASEQALVNRYCLGCHNEKLKSGSFSWAKVDLAHPAQSAEQVEKALGMAFVELNDKSRLKFSIKGSVVSGIVVTDVDPDSAAADKHIQPGEVIEEVNQQAVETPSDVTKAIAALKAAGKKSALLLVATGTGDVRFVALSLD